MDYGLDYWLRIGPSFGLVHCQSVNGLLKGYFPPPPPPHGWQPLLRLMWNMEAACFLYWRKSFALTAILEWWQTSTAPSAFPASDASGKVWSTLLTTQQEGIYPKSSLGFATCMCKISLANILALHVLSVNVRLGCIFGPLRYEKG